MAEELNPLSETEALLMARYKELCAKRDKVNAKIAPIQSQLDAANEKVNKAKDEARSLADEIQKLRGGQSWLDLKREIGLLAKSLSGKFKVPEPESEAD